MGKIFAPFMSLVSPLPSTLIPPINSLSDMSIGLGESTKQPILNSASLQVSVVVIEDSSKYH